MEKSFQNSLSAKSDAFFKITAVEAVTVAVIIVAVLVLKSFLPKQYGKVREFYESRFTDDTDTDEFFGDIDEV